MPENHTPTHNLILQDFAAVKWEWVDGKTIETRKGKCNPLPEQVTFAEELLRLLNVKASHDGTWRVEWLEPKPDYYDSVSKIWKRYVPTLCEAQWLDADGDVILAVEMADETFKMLEIGLSRWVDQCETAWKMAHNQLHELEIKPEHTIQSKRGQIANDALIQNTPDFIF